MELVAFIVLILIPAIGLVGFVFALEKFTNARKNDTRPPLFALIATGIVGSPYIVPIAIILAIVIGGANLIITICDYGDRAIYAVWDRIQAHKASKASPT